MVGRSNIDKKCELNPSIKNEKLLLNDISNSKYDYF